MGLLSILGIILLLAIAITMPPIGIPLVIGGIILGIIYRILKGGASITYKGLKALTNKSPPTTPGELADQYCTKCNTRLLKIPGEEGYWCPNCQMWYI